MISECRAADQGALGDVKRFVLGNKLIQSMIKTSGPRIFKCSSIGEAGVGALFITVLKDIFVEAHGAAVVQVPGVNSEETIFGGADDHAAVGEVAEVEIKRLGNGGRVL